MRRAPALCALALAGCVTVEVPPRTSTAVAVEADEGRLWQTAAEAERRVAERGRLHDDPALDAYLLEVVRRLEPPELLAANPVRVRVLVDPRPGAFALPNGAVYLHAGLLARMESEAELATVLSHELVHVTHRHGLRHFRRAQAWGIGATGLVRLASVTGYVRELEGEADREGLARVRAAGYDLADAPRLLERLRAWAAAEGLKDETTFYSSHPRLEERIAACRAMAAAAPPGGAREADRFVRASASVLLENARAELAAGRYRAAWDQVQRQLSLEPARPAAHLLLGEIARREDGQGAQDSAVASYRRALELDPKLAEAWRGLGLALSKKGDRDGARAAFVRYLEVAPDAPDRAHVEAALHAVAGGRTP